jgi:PAS domain S-box-containing protein
MLVSLALLPMLGLILYNGIIQRQAATKQAGVEIFRTTQQFSSEYDRVVEGAHQLLIGLAQTDTVRMPGNWGNCSVFLAQVRDKFSQYSTIGVTNKAGDILCSAVPPSSPVNISDRLYFRRAIQNREFSAGEYQIGRITGTPQITFGYPVIDEGGDIQGIVFASLRLDWLPNLMADTPPPAGVKVSLIDGQGTILACFPKSDQCVGQKLDNPALLKTIQEQMQGTTETVAAGGGTLLVGFDRLISAGETQGIEVVSSNPTTLAYASADRNLVINLVIFGVVALLTIIAAWAGAYLFLLRRVNSMVRAFRRLAAGDMSARSERSFGFRELAELGQAFDDMVAALQQQQAEIKVASDALRQSEAHYRSLVEMSPEGILIYSDWKIEFVNTMGVRMIGAETPDQVIGRSILDMVPEAYHEVVRERGRLLMEERQPAVLLEWTLIKLDGTLLDVESIATPCIFNDKPAAQVIIHDISEKKIAEVVRMRRAEEIEALYQNSLELTAQLDLSSLLRGISERAARLLGAQIGAVYLVIPEGNELELTAAYNLPNENLLGARLKLGEGVSGIAAQTGETTLVDDYQVFEKRANQYDGIPFGRVLAVPMKLRDRVIGVITVTDERRTGAYNPEETQLMRLFADQAAIAVENARLYETAQRELAEREISEQNQKRLVAELSALHAVSLAGMEATELDDLTERVTQIVGERFYPDDFGIGFLDESQAKINFHSSYRIRSGATVPDIRVGKGISGWVAQHKKPRRVSDVRNDPDYLNADPLILSELCVPILQGDRLVGVINAESRQLDGFSQADERLLTALAGEMGIALEKLRLLGQERRRRQEAETLRISTAALTSTLDRERVIEQLLDCLGQVVPYDSISIMLRSGNQTMITAERGFRNTRQWRVLEDVSRLAHVCEVLDRGRPLIIADTRKDSRWMRITDGDYIRCWMGVPLVVKDQVIGVINLDKCEPGFYHAEDAELALAFANQAATAIENARLYESELQRNQELAAVGKVSEALRSAPTPVEMSPIILDQLMDLLALDAAALMIYDVDLDEVRLADGRGTWKLVSELARDPGAEMITRSVIQSGRLYENSNILQNSELAQNPLFKNLRSITCMPLVAQEQVIGVLQIGRSSPLIERDKHLLAAVGELSANALHRAQLHDQTVQRLKRLTILRKVDMAITSSMDATFTLSILIEEMLSGLQLDAACVVQLNSASYTLEWITGKGFDSTSLVHARMGMPSLTAMSPDNPQVRAVLEREPVLVEDLSTVKNERARQLAQDGFSAGIVLPLISKGEVMGLMEVFQRGPLTRDRELIDFIESLAGQAAIAMDNAALFDNLERSNLELSLAYDATIEGWARALDLRNEETERHSLRVVEKTLALARFMGLSDSELVHIRRGAFLHDIGKIAVPDEIMNKPGPLSESEWEVMRKHPLHGYQLLSPISYLRQAIDIPYYHHEKWDGTGYPHGLREEEIPLSARIFAVVDVWDALLNDRPYRKAWPEEQVQAYLRDQSGRHFDPRVVDAFFAIEGWDY